MQKYSFDIFSKFRGELMGIAILGVCLLHAFGWAGIGDSAVTKAVGPFARIAFTDGFLFLSGYGLYYSFSKKHDLKAFYIKRFNRVWLPYMMMGLPFLLYGLIWGETTMMKFLLKMSSLYFWLFGNDGMWYISMSIALYAIFPFAYKFIFGNARSEKVIIGRTLLLVLLCIVACLSLYSYAPSYYELLAIGITKSPMFFIGMLVAYYSCGCKKSLLYQILIAGGGMCVTFVAKRYSDFLVPYYEMCYRLLAMPLVCIVFMKFDMQRLRQILQWFGRYSLEIYVLQMFVLGIVGKGLEAVACPSVYLPAVQTILTFGIVIAFCAPIHKGIDKIIKRIE